MCMIKAQITDKELTAHLDKIEADQLRILQWLMVVSAELSFTEQDL